jgi:cellulose synthase/poly-beta-1,6-N-acetylglucosamine synthase-like glycosyltransferase
MRIAHLLLEILYLANVAFLAAYGLNALVLAGLRWWRPKPPPVVEVDPDYDWPQVIVQLPIYNERYVVERLIKSIAAFDYPRQRLQIQVLDDSNDITSDIIARLTASLQQKGINIEHIQRPSREGFKGGALAHGMNRAAGEFIAIFDADFLPPADFLKRTIPYFDRDPRTGCVQTRWGHINRENSLLTRAEANGIDGHFVIEQETRSQNNLFLNFNGTAGVWRRECIADAGGWQHETLTEDLDLSYRAQLRGWKIQYLPHVTSPAELPAQIGAFKSQQFRWAKGSVQTARKLLPDLWRSPQPLAVKIEGTLHLTHYFVHPLMLLNLLLVLPLLLSGNFLLNIYPAFAISAIGPLFMYMTSMGQRGLPLGRRLFSLVMLVLVGMGLSLNNTRAVGEALFAVRSPFQRTPKYNLDNRTGPEKALDYLLPRDYGVWIELALSIYSFALLLLAVRFGNWGLIFWLSLFSAGFAYISGLGFLQAQVKKRLLPSARDVFPASSRPNLGQD